MGLRDALIEDLIAGTEDAPVLGRHDEGCLADHVLALWGLTELSHHVALLGELRVQKSLLSTLIEV